MTTPPEPPPPPPPPPPPSGPPIQYGQVAAPYPYARPPVTNSKATAAMILGICGLVVCPLICSVLAIIFGVIAKREIDAAPGMQGRGMAQAGLIMGIVGTALAVIFIIFYVVLFAALVNTGVDVKNDSYYQFIPPLNGLISF